MVNFDFNVCTLFAKSVIYFIPLLLMCERTFFITPVFMLLLILFVLTQEDYLLLL